MLIVISYPMPVAKEAEIINAMFEEGLETLHIRKPGLTQMDVRTLLEAIKPVYHPKIALHQHHEIAADLDIKRLHFTEISRKKTNDVMLSEFKKDGNRLSTSVHNIDEYNGLSEAFDYTFFGPVFDSISKPGYEAIGSDEFVFPVKAGRPKVIALGGISAENVGKAMEMKFEGVAALGYIWERPEESIERFKLLQKEWKAAGQ